MKARHLTTLAALLVLTAAALPATAAESRWPAVRTVGVDCAAGKTIDRALKLPAAHLIIEISGTCIEDVLIERSGVTLKGVTPDAGIQGDSATRASAVTVRGASRVELQDLAVTDGETIGIRIQRNAEAVLRNVRLTDTPFFGLLVELDSSVLLADTSITDHGFFAAGIFASTLTLQGTNELSRNGQVGLLLTSGARVHTNGVGRLVASDNGATGIFFQAGSRGLFPSIEAKGNGFAGLDLSFGGELFSIGNNDLSGNGVYGVTLGDGASYFAAGRILDNGTAGIFAQEGSHVNVATDVPSHIGGSPVAVLLEGATGTFGGTTQEVGTVTIDGTMELAFGTRATFGTDVTLEALVCDPTVLTRGAISCPASLDAGIEPAAVWSRPTLPRSQQPTVPPID